MHAMQQHAGEGTGQPEDPEEGGGLSGEVIMRIPTEVFSRVVGYLRPISSWNPGKISEYKDRVNFDVPKGDELANRDV